MSDSKNVECCTGCMRECRLDRPKCSFGENLAKQKGIKKAEEK